MNAMQTISKAADRAGELAGRLCLLLEELPPSDPLRPAVSQAAADLARADERLARAFAAHAPMPRPCRPSCTPAPEPPPLASADAAGVAGWLDRGAV